MTPCVTRAPKGGSRNISKPQDDLTPVESEASSMADLSFHSLDGGSNEENGYDSLSSHTTASSSTSADFQSTETNSPVPDSITEANLVQLCLTKKILVKHLLRYSQKLQIQNHTQANNNLIL